MPPDFVKKMWIYFAVFSFLLSCRSTNRLESSSITKKYKNKFNRALRHLENKRYSQAAADFQALAGQTKKNSHDITHWSVLFNLGSAYEGLKNCKKAEDIFSRLLSKIKDDTAFEVRSLLRLHYAYECLGQPEKALTALQSADQKSYKLPLSSRLVEIPARFSILYAQLNDHVQSMKYQNQTFDGIKKIKSPIKGSLLIKRKGAELFFIMGRSFARPSYISLKPYLLALPLHQIYLIQSFLLQDPLWSPLAKEELINLYEKLWISYKKLPKNQKPLYKNKITKALGDLQRIALESENSKLNKLKTKIIDKALSQIRL